MQVKTIVVAAVFWGLGANSGAYGSDVQIAARTVPTLTAAPTAVVETIVETDLESTWDELVSELGGRGFEINALFRDDRTIRVLLQSEVPSRYVDCGEISVQSRHAMFGDRRYKFLAANSVRYMVADEATDALIDVERRTTLNALANIRLAPADRGTAVRIEAVYAMKIKTREFASREVIRKADHSLQFDSASQASKNESIRQGATSKSVNYECRANGVLERQIASVLPDAN